MRAPAAFRRASARLINVVRQLGLVYDNTIYMNREVPSGPGAAQGRQETAEMNCGGGPPRTLILQ